MKTGDRAESHRAFGHSEIEDELARPAGMSRLSVQIGADEPVLLYGRRDAALMIGQRLLFSNKVLTDADDRINDVSVRSCWTGEMVGVDPGAKFGGSTDRGIDRRSVCKTPGCRRRVSFYLHPSSYQNLDDLDYCDSCVKDREENAAVALLTAEAARLRRIGKSWNEVGTGMWIGGLVALYLVAGSGVGVCLALLVGVLILSEMSHAIGFSYRNKALLTIRAISDGASERSDFGSSAAAADLDATASQSAPRKFSCGASFSPDIDGAEDAMPAAITR